MINDKRCLWEGSRRQAGPRRGLLLVVEGRRRAAVALQNPADGVPGFASERSIPHKERAGAEQGCGGRRPGSMRAFGWV